MIIKSLKIDSFGKLKFNKQIDLVHGLNLIYGPNEAGKSTVQNFVKTMLFGMQSKRGRSRDTHEREMLIPWDSDNAAGHIVIQTDNGKNYRIQRTFSRNSYKADTLDIFDERTGNPAKICTEPGMEFMGISRETFENTLFVRQLMCSNINDDNKHIYSRIINLRQTGNENIQAGKARNILSDKIAELEGRKRNVSIDFIRKQINEKIDELEQLYSVHGKMLDNEKQLSNYKLHMKLIENNLRLLEKKRKNAEYWRKRRIYETVSTYIAEKVDAQTKVSDLNKYEKFAEADFEKFNSLKTERDSLYKLTQDKYSELQMLEQSIEQLKKHRKDWNITEEQIEQLREIKPEYKNLLDQYNEYSKKLIGLKHKLSEVKQAMPEFDGVDQPDENIDNVIKVKIDEIDLIEKQIEDSSNNIDRYQQFNSEIVEKQQYIQSLSDKLGYDVLPDVSCEDFEREEVISREIAESGNNEWLIRKTIQKENFEKQKSDIEKHIKMPKYLIIPALVAFGTGSMGAALYMPLISLCFVGVGIYIYGLFMIHNKQNTINVLIDNIAKIEKEINDTDEKNKSSREWRAEFYKKLCVDNREQYLKVKKEIETYVFEKNKLEPVIKELRNDIMLIDIDKENNILNELTKKKQELSDFINNIYAKFKCDNFYTFSRNLRKFAEYAANYEMLEQAYNNMLATIEDYNSKIEHLRNKVKQIIKDSDINDDNNVITVIDELIRQFDKDRSAVSLLSINEDRYLDVATKSEATQKQIEQLNKQISDILSSLNVDSEQDFIEGIEKYNEYYLYSKRIEQLEQLISSTIGEYDIYELEKECNSCICDYSEDSVEKIDELIKLEREALHDVKENVIRLDTLVNNVGDMEKISLLQEEISSLEARKNSMQRRLEMLKIAKCILDESLDEMVNDFGVTLNSETQRIISRLTDGRYNEVKINENDFSIKAYEPDAAKFVNANLLSNGTIDQLYFAMRLATANMIEDNVKLPVILDDAFIQYDDKRLRKTLEFLLEYSKTRQVMLFTCQKRENNILAELKGKYNYFDLSHIA